jgi:hypothetical protein
MAPALTTDTPRHAARKDRTMAPTVRYLAAIAAVAAFLWHFHEIARVTRSPNPTFPWIPAILAVSCTMYALYVWFAGRRD